MGFRHARCFFCFRIHTYASGQQIASPFPSRPSYIATIPYYYWYLSSCIGRRVSPAAATSSTFSRFVAYMVQHVSVSFVAAAAPAYALKVLHKQSHHNPSPVPSCLSWEEAKRDKRRDKGRRNEMAHFCPINCPRPFQGPKRGLAKAFHPQVAKLSNQSPSAPSNRCPPLHGLFVLREQ